MDIDDADFTFFFIHAIRRALINVIEFRRRDDFDLSGFTQFSRVPMSGNYRNWLNNYSVTVWFCENVKVENGDFFK